jgi:hypothetical protein
VYVCVCVLFGESVVLSVRRREGEKERRGEEGCEEKQEASSEQQQRQSVQ